MKLKCLICQKDFTTLGDLKLKCAVIHLDFKNLKCPYCGNRNYKNDEPNIIIHPQCRPHIAGNTAQCEVCESYFHCLTGNVDDGIHNVPIDQTTTIEAVQQNYELLMARERTERVDRIKSRLKALGFTYRNKILAYKGTKWKLSEDDLKAIKDLTFSTKKTRTIYNTARNVGIDSILINVIVEN